MVVKVDGCFGEGPKKRLGPSLGIMALKAGGNRSGGEGRWMFWGRSENVVGTFPGRNGVESDGRQKLW